MKRRLVLGVGTLGVAALEGCGQPQRGPAAKRMPRLGFLDSGSRRITDLADHPFSRGLRELGYAEGNTVAVDYRFADYDDQRLRQALVELLGAGIQVLVTEGSAATGAARSSTATLPIVQAVGGDPVVAGWAVSLAHPGGNVTGHLQSPRPLVGKRLSLLAQAVPGLSVVGVAVDPGNGGHRQTLEAVQEAATPLTLKVVSLEASRPEELEPAFLSAAARGAGGVIIPLSGLFLNYAARLAAIAVANHLPSISDWGLWAERGGLLANSANLDDLERRAAGYVDKILKGAKPGDLPVELPTKFDFVVNLKTAQALGLTLRQSVLAQATEVIR